jgi:hypothetical protein
MRGPVWGAKVINRACDKARRGFKEDMDISGTCRFVRYLPEYARVGWSGRRPVAPVSIYQDERPIIVTRNPVKYTTINSVTIGYYPDACLPGESFMKRDSYGRSGE